ncbi:MAG: fumarylacetoacetase, partial [Vulcanimicrobiaceae bacterium]
MVARFAAGSGGYSRTGSAREALAARPSIDARMPKIEDADATTDPAARSWIGVAGDSDFPIQNLPYGIFARADDVATIGVAIGDRILDLCAVAAAGLLDDAVPEARVVFAEPTLNGFIACGRPTWRAARERIFALLGVGNRELHDAEILDYALVAADEIEMRLPVAVGDYVDFYSSLNHATNAGRIFRPNAEPLFPNWRRLPVGYHGRSGSVVVSGTPIVRPSGQKKIDGADEPAFGPTEMLDFELEIGFITGDANGLGATLPVVRARDAIFGVVLLNDWSARDIQAWESQPLGPFLGKSFATSISPWVVTLDALAPFRVAGPPQMPPPSPYLAVAEPRGYSIDLTVELQSKMMRAAGIVAQTLARTNAREL